MSIYIFILIGGRAERQNKDDYHFALRSDDEADDTTTSVFFCAFLHVVRAAEESRSGARSDALSDKMEAKESELVFQPINK